jgi:hypothetical protein
VVYLKVNAQAKSGIELSAQALRTLQKVNEPDYLLYDYFNKTLWATVEELGRYNKRRKNFRINFL